MSVRWLKRSLCAGMLGLLLTAPAMAAPFTTGYDDGGSWNSIFAQGFTPSLAPTPNPGLAAGDTVYLNSFSFFKSGNADTTSTFRLAIINNIFADLTGFSTSSPILVGLSDNSFAGSASVALNAEIEFTFNSLPLTFGNNYAAVYVIESGGGALTPVLVPSLVTNYVEGPPTEFHPQTNYGTEAEFVYAVSNFITTNGFGSFFNTFSFAGDANFSATLDTVVPEPSMGLMIVAGAALMAVRRSRQRPV